MNRLIRYILLILSGLSVIFTQSYALSNETDTPLPSSSRLKICAIYPHLKDSYWLSVNYGMVRAAEHYGNELRVLESGGYPNLSKQKEQLDTCVKWKSDAIILGTVSPDAYLDDLSELIKDIPLFIAVNHLNTTEPQKAQVKGTVGADWYWMGHLSGELLKQRHPRGTGKVKVALLPGPSASGGTKPVVIGFYDAIADADVEVVATLWGDNDKEIQRDLVQEIIEMNDVDYIVGSAVAIEAAVSELRSANLTSEVKLISTYLSHGVYRALIRNKVEFSPSDLMVEQGRLSIEQVNDWATGNEYNAHYQPTIAPLTPDSLSNDIIHKSLSPSEFRPIFHVN